MWELRAEFRDIPRDYFLEAVEKYVKSIAEDLTGKDVSKTADRLCIRKIFDSCQLCRIAKEDTKARVISTIQIEGIKFIITLVAAFSGALLYIKNAGS